MMKNENRNIEEEMENDKTEVKQKGEEDKKKKKRWEQRKVINKRKVKSDKCNAFCVDEDRRTMTRLRGT
jgi:hypothetical protein